MFAGPSILLSGSWKASIIRSLSPGNIILALPLGLSVTKEIERCPAVAISPLEISYGISQSADESGWFQPGGRVGRPTTCASLLQSTAGMNWTNGAVPICTTLYFNSDRGGAQCAFC